MDENNQKQQNNVPGMREAGKLAKNKASKKIKKSVEKAVKSIAKVLRHFIRMVLLPLLPYILIFVGTIIIGWVAYDMLFEDKGPSQEYQDEDSSQINDTTLDENTGYIIAPNLSVGNKVVKAFYTYFSEKSLYVTITDKNGHIVQKEPIQYNSPEFIRKYGNKDTCKIKDKYQREKYFYLSPDALWSLDQYLNSSQFRFPEQFIKPVYYDKDTFALKELIDNKDKMVVKSTKYKYDKNKKEYVATNEKTPGVWDYGFGSVLHYKEFEEEREARGNYTTTQIWDVNNNKFITVSTDTAKKMCENSPKDYQGFNSSYGSDKKFTDKQAPEQSYMIDKVTTPAGFIENAISKHWVNTNKKYTKHVTYNATVEVIKTRKVQKKSKDSDGVEHLVYLDKDGNETYDSETVIVQDTETGTVTKTISNRRVMVDEKYRDKENKKFEATGEGNIWQNTPVYDSEPDTSNITGGKYYRDYISHYKTYVPDNVMGNLGVAQLKDRTGKDLNDLLSLLNTDNSKTQSATDSTVTGSTISNFKLGMGADDGNLKGAAQYFDLIKKYAEPAGIDPYFVLALMANESGGDMHCSCGEAYGLLQVSYVNYGTMSIRHTDGSVDTFECNAGNYKNDADMQVRAGIACLQHSMNTFDNNIAVAVMGYNFGEGGIRKCLRHYASVKYGDGSDAKVNEIIHNNDMGWVTDSQYRKWYQSTANAGTWDYLERCLRYYVNPTKGKYPWVTDKNGTVHSLDGSTFTTGGTCSTSSSSSILNWLSGIWDKIKNGFATLFPDVPKELSPNTFVFENGLPENNTDTVIKLMFAMNEKKHLSDYDGLKDSDWKKMYHILFTNPLGTPWNGINSNVNAKDWFPNGYVKPLSINPLTIKTPFNESSHPGVDIVAPPGTTVECVADGEVVEVDSSGSGKYGKSIKVKHDGGVYTVYAALDTISVSKGQHLVAGQRIGTTGKNKENQAVLHFELLKGDKPSDPTWMISDSFNTNLSSYHMTEEDKQIIEKVLNLGATKFGCRYTQELGLRTGPNTFDCSGYAWWLYKQITGVDIGLNTYQQADTLANYKVSMSNLQPGDLVMYGNLAHVAIYAGKNANGQDTTIEAANPVKNVCRNTYGNINSYFSIAFRPIAYIHAMKK